MPLTEGQTLVYQVPIPEPLRFLEPRETETRKMHALEEYGLMHVKLYEDIAKHGHIATTYAYPVKVEGRYVMDPSPTPKFDNPKMHMSPALQLFGAGREKRIYAIPPFTEVVSLDFEDHPFEVQTFDKPCALCGAEQVYLDEVVLDDHGGRMFVCSDTDHCENGRRAEGHVGEVGRERQGGSRNDRRTTSPRLLAVEILRLPRRLRGRIVRAVAGRGAGGRRRIRLGQDDAAELPLDAADADVRLGLLPHARRRFPRPLPHERGGAPLPDAHRLGFRPPEPGRWAAHDGFGRRQCRRAADGGRRPALRQDPRAAVDWLARVEIGEDRVDDEPRAFSGGMRQRLQIARNLVTGPRLVFMDEPTGGLDVSVQARLLDLLRGLVNDLGLAAIIVTHDLAVARLLSHRMMVMKDGHVVETGLTDRVLDDPRAPYTQLLVSSILQV